MDADPLPDKFLKLSWRTCECDSYHERPNQWSHCVWRRSRNKPRNRPKAISDCPLNDAMSHSLFTLVNGSHCPPPLSGLTEMFNASIFPPDSGLKAAQSRLKWAKTALFHIAPDVLFRILDDVQFKFDHKTVLAELSDHIKGADNDYKSDIEYSDVKEDRYYYKCKNHPFVYYFFTRQEEIRQMELAYDAMWDGVPWA